jgi:26S proteasome non-ATPase regulatory subunit 10
MTCGACLQASKGFANIMRQLLKAGAKVNAKDKTGSTPLHRASGAGKFETALVLLEEGHAKVDSHDKTGSTALSLAVACKEANIAILLASKGANLEVSHHTPCL